MQIVLYIGPKPLKMAGRIDDPNLQFRYEVIDLSTIDAEVLLKSKSVDDKILAILCHADDEQRKIRRILQSLTPFPAKIQGDKITQLLVLSRLRGLTDMVTEEVQRQHALQEIFAESPALTKWAHKIADQLIEQRVAHTKKDLEKDAAKTALQAEAKLLTRMLEAKFGKAPKWAKEKIAAANARTLEKWAVRLLKAETLEEALP